MRRASVLCPDATRRAGLEAALRLPAAGFDEVGVFDEARRDPGELLVVDLGSPPSAVHQRRLIHDLQRRDPEREFLLLVEGWRTDRVGFLLSHGLGNLFESDRPAPPMWNDLAAESRRVLDLGAGRRAARADRERGVEPSVPARSSPVFLSHSRDTRPLALGMRRFLEMGGPRVWWWETDGDPAPSPVDRDILPLPGGAAPARPPLLLERMNEALDAAEVLVAIVSAAWLESPICEEELERFERAPRRPVLPLLVDPRLRSDAAVAKLMSRSRAPYSMAGLGAQAAWVRAEIRRRRAGGGTIRRANP
jgi:hypothetical protein